MDKPLGKQIPCLFCPTCVKLACVGRGRDLKAVFQLININDETEMLKLKTQLEKGCQPVYL